jgi:hypothetical protein
MLEIEGKGRRSAGYGNQNDKRINSENPRQEENEPGSLIKRKKTITNNHHTRKKGPLAQYATIKHSSRTAVLATCFDDQRRWMCTYTCDENSKASCCDATFFSINACPSTARSTLSSPVARHDKESVHETARRRRKRKKTEERNGNFSNEEIIGGDEQQDQGRTPARRGDEKQSKED